MILLQRYFTTTTQFIYAYGENFFQLGWVLHPIYSATGDYPPVMKEWMAKKCKEEGYSRSRLPSFTKEEIEMVKGEVQFRANSDVTKNN